PILTRRMMQPSLPPIHTITLPPLPRLRLTTTLPLPLISQEIVSNLQRLPISRQQQLKHRIKRLPSNLHLLRIITARPINTINRPHSLLRPLLHRPINTRPTNLLPNMYTQQTTNSIRSSSSLQNKTPNSQEKRIISHRRHRRLTNQTTNMTRTNHSHTRVNLLRRILRLLRHRNPPRSEERRVGQQRSARRRAT